MAQSYIKNAVAKLFRTLKFPVLDINKTIYLKYDLLTKMGKYVTSNNNQVEN